MLAKEFSMSGWAGAHHFRLVKSITLSHTYVARLHRRLTFLMRSSSIPTLDARRDQAGSPQLGCIFDVDVF